MVDWRGSSLQIVIALIGSSLILTALTSLTSYFIKPSLDIYVKVEDWPYMYAETFNETLPKSNSTTYRIYLVNNGYSTAKDVRLTMNYPDAVVLDTTKVFENENFTITNKTSNPSVVTLTRLSPGIMIAVENIITGNINGFSQGLNPLFDLQQGTFFEAFQDSVYIHHDPFSVTVTYDQGGKTYAPSAMSKLYRDNYEFITQDELSIIIPILTIVTGLLLFGIAFRHKRTGMSKFASKILKDIEATIRRLRTVIDSRAVLTFKNYDLYHDNLDQVFDNYKDYKLIEDFYTGLKERASKIAVMMKDDHLENNELSDLEHFNKSYLNRAVSALNDIDWKKFYKFDLILLLPAIILASTFISYVCDGGVFYLLSWGQEEEVGGWSILSYIIISFLVRSLAAYYVMRLILYRVQGFSITTRVLPVVSQPKKFFRYCVAIMGISDIFLILPLYFVIGEENLYTTGVTTFSLIIIFADIARMFLLLWLVSRSLGTKKKEENILVKGKV